MTDRPNDSAAKELQTHHTQDIAAWLALPARPVQLLDTDVASLQGSVDGVFRVPAAGPESPEHLVHVAWQASHQADLPDRELENTVLLRRKYRMLVRTIVIYLRRDAYRGKRASRLIDRLGTEQIIDFRMTPVRIWETPIPTLLARLGTMPLATAAARDEGELRQVIDAISRRVATEPEDVQSRIAVASYVFTGLNFELSLAEDLVRRHPAMEESVTYQAIKRKGLAEGRAEGRAAGREEGMHAMLLALGTERLGTPDAATVDALNAVHDPDRLVAIGRRIFTAESWADLLDRP